MNRRILRVAVWALVLCLCGSFAAADDFTQEERDGKGKAGISLPTEDLQHWVLEGKLMQEELNEKGYNTILSYNSDAEAQIADLNNMISAGCDVLIVAAVDGFSLKDVMDEAKKAGIMVVAYDRMIFDTEAIDFYVTCDNYAIGVTQGYYIINKLDLKNTDRVYRMEVFAGSPDDFNAQLFYNGAMDVLRPYIDYGKLVIPSGETDFETCAVSWWPSDEAQARMDSLLAKYYPDGSFPDVVLSPNDSIALGITNSLEEAGCPVGSFPVITGQDCDTNNIKNIIAGKQSMSVFKDPRYLCSMVVEMVNAWYTGEEVPVNDVVTYNNNMKIIPTFRFVPVYIDVTNYELLIDEGYYTEEELQ